MAGPGSAAPTRRGAVDGASGVAAMARAGLVAQGVMYLIIGALALQLARTSSDPREEAAAAGQAWGARLAGGVRPRPRTAASARRGVVEVLDDLGFAPEPDARSSTVRLRECPLLEAAREHPEVVCSVHLGIARGVDPTPIRTLDQVKAALSAEAGASR